MAEVVNSLFGITPESLQAQRDAALQAQALQYAKLNPFERANVGIYTGVSKLGNAIGGMLGAQDPEMMRLQQRQNMLQELDLTNPESLKQGIQTAMQNKDYQLVSELTNRYQQRVASDLASRKTESEITKNLREKAGADPVQQLLRTGKYTIPSMAAYEQSGNITDLVPIDPNEPTALSETKEGIFLINKRTGDKIQRIGDAPERASKLSVNPEIKMAPDIVGAVNASEKATEKEVDMLESAQLAKQLINQTAKSNNSQTWEAARTTMARAVGLNKLSNEDIRRTGVDPRLVQGALDWVNKKIEGVPNADIQKQLYTLSSVLENNASSRYNAKIDRFRGAAQAAKFPGNPSTYFPTAAERTGVQGSTANVVDWSTLPKK
jgi:hypothetical protein